MAQRSADLMGHAFSQAIAGTMAGLVALRRGHLDGALLLLERSLEACREKHLTVWQPIPSSLLGLVYVGLGRPDEAVPLLEQGVTLSRDLGIYAYLALGRRTSPRGSSRQVRRSARSRWRGGATSRARSQGAGPSSVVSAHRRHLDGRRAVGRGARGERLRAGGRGAQELGMRPLLARTALGIGRLHLRLGNRAKAEEYLITATTMFREMDMRFCWSTRART